MLVAVAAVSMLALASCKKDFECECTSEFGNYTVKLEESKRAAAAAVCEGEGIGKTTVNGEEVDISGGDDCKLK